MNQDFTGSVMSNFIAAGSGYMIASFLLWATAGTNNLVLGDGNTNLGLYLQAGKINSYNQGQWAPALGSGFATANSTPYVAEWRHEGGNLYCRLNGGSWSGATVSGNSTLTGALNIGGKGGSGPGSNKFLRGRHMVDHSGNRHTGCCRGRFQGVGWRLTHPIQPAVIDRRAPISQRCRHALLRGRLIMIWEGPKAWWGLNADFNTVIHIKRGEETYEILHNLD